MEGVRAILKFAQKERSRAKTKTSDPCWLSVHCGNLPSPACAKSKGAILPRSAQLSCRWYSLLVCVDRIQLPWLKNIRNSLELLTSYSYLRMLISQRGDGSVLKSTWHTNRRGRGQISRARVRLGLAAQVRKPISSRAALLNLWVKTIWWIKGLFHRSRLRLSEISDIYITIHNSSKATVI